MYHAEGQGRAGGAGVSSVRESRCVSCTVTRVSCMGVYKAGFYAFLNHDPCSIKYAGQLGDVR